MKKILSILFIVLVLISTFSFIASAKDPVSLKLTSEQVYAGDETTLNLYVSANSDISGATIDINYDDKMLEFVSAKEGAILDSKANISIRNIKKDNAYVRFTYLSTSSSIISEGILMSVTFKALESASGETELTISVPHPDDFISIDAENLKYNIVNSKVKILNNIDDNESTTEITEINSENITAEITESITEVDNNKVDIDNKIIVNTVILSALVVGIILIIVGIVIIKKNKKS